jgi:hypothetical protein
VSDAQLKLKDAQFDESTLWLDRQDEGPFVLQVQVTGYNGDSDEVRLTRDQALEIIDFVADIVITRER